MSIEQIQIVTASLKAVRRISELAFSKKLGDEFALNYSTYSAPGIISMHLTKNDKHCECFVNVFDNTATSWQCLFPKSKGEIVSFEIMVQKALDDIFNYVESSTSDHEKSMLSQG